MVRTCSRLGQVEVDQVAQYNACPKDHLLNHSNKAKGTANPKGPFRCVVVICSNIIPTGNLKCVRDSMGDITKYMCFAELVASVDHGQ